MLLHPACRQAGGSAAPSLSDALEPHLACFSYVSGHSPSRLDARVHERLRAPPPPQLVHVTRWWHHVRQRADEAAGWPEMGDAALSRLGVDPRILYQVGRDVRPACSEHPAGHRPLAPPL